MFKEHGIGMKGNSSNSKGKVEQGEEVEEFNKQLMGMIVKEIARKREEKEEREMVKLEIRFL